MSRALKVPSSIEEIIQYFDASKEAIDELALSERIGKVRNALADPSEAERAGAWAEALAFALQSGGERSPWNTYFRPMGSMSDKDGNTQVFPDIVCSYERKPIEAYGWHVIAGIHSLRRMR